MSKEFFEVEAGEATATYIEGMIGDPSVANGTCWTCEIEDINGELATIYFSGKKVVEVRPNANCFVEYFTDHRHFDREAAEIEESLNHINTVLKTITNKHISREEAMAVVEYNFVNETEAVDNWKDYFQEVVFQYMWADMDGFILEETFLPDFKPLKEGKLVFDGKLVAEAGKGYIK